MRIAVIADDITGALDTRVQFKKWGLNVEIFMNIDEIETSESTDVVITDTESRYDAPETAYNKVYSVAKILTRSGFDIIYKKIDSTFRGNIGSELDALMDATKEDVVYLCSAYPLNGRSVKSGCLHVNGETLKETEYISELPSDTSDIAELLSLQSSRKIGRISIEKIRCGELKSQIERLIEDGKEIIVFDSEIENQTSLR